MGMDMEVRLWQECFTHGHAMDMDMDMDMEVR